MRLILCLALALFIFSCKNNKNIPDVGDINIDLTVKRFEKELFSLDTNQLSTQVDQLIASYPSFGENFLTTILNTDPAWSADSASAYLRGFITSYRNIYDSIAKKFADFSSYEDEIKKGLRFVKHYFPAYKLPKQVITYIGPLDGYGDILTEDAFIVGLHQHLGKDFPPYKTTWVQETYPEYISNRFEPDYIAINCMKNIVTDMYPEKKEDGSLAVQMVEKGKRLYLLSKFLPYSDEYKLIGYTKTQLKDCYEHEAGIWDLFVQNNLLQVIDNNIIKNYIGESPKTQELGNASPGNIGSFAGWQIIKKFMEESPKISLPEMMSMDAETIFQRAKYKP